MSESRPMGLGNLVTPKTIFVRKFRWTLGGPRLPDVYQKNVKFNWTKKEVEFESYEVTADDGSLPILDWLEKEPKKDTLYFTTYDGCGGLLYQYTLQNVEVLEHTSDFDYSSSDESTRKIKAKFGSYTLVQTDDDYICSPNARQWKISFEDEEEEYDVQIEKEMSIHVDKTELNRLNAKTWIPGKAKWNPAVVVTNNVNVIKKIGNTFYSELKTAYSTIKLKGYSYDQDKSPFSLVLKETWISSLYFDADTDSMTITFNPTHVIYEDSDSKK